MLGVFICLALAVMFWFAERWREIDDRIEEFESTPHVLHDEEVA